MGLDDLVNKAKGLAEKGKDVAGDLTVKGKEVAGDLTEKGKEVAGELTVKGKEVAEIAKGEGSIGDKAKAALGAVKEPGAPKPE